MKGLELNGLANIHALVYIYQAELPEDFKNRLNDQLDILKRYLIAHADSLAEGPKWHEVRDNKEQYPTQRSFK